ncbi:TPA: hypothetical protein VPG64_001418 [Streptococcus pyogenes]|nr:hypothetical protein [Streptococcus pyogenes]
MKWSDFMKTKSKRFLNLATLCLALLGTTLLMARPVKAEVEQATGERVTAVGTDDEDSSIRQKYFETWGRGDENLTGQYYQGRLDGYVDGYKEGQKPDSSKEPKDGYQTKKGDNEYKNGYNDTYPLGHHDGWEEEHPVQALLDFIWTVLSGFFFSSGS